MLCGCSECCNWHYMAYISLPWYVGAQQKIFSHEWCAPIGPTTTDVASSLSLSSCCAHLPTYFLRLAVEGWSLLLCAYANTPKVLYFVTDADWAVVMSRWPLWKLINGSVVNDSPMHPVHVFRHALQVFYSRTNGGVDYAAQLRSELKCSGVCMGWESKVVLCYIKTLLVNGFSAWGLTACNDYLRSSAEFVSLERFSDNLNRTMELSNFPAEISQRLLDYAKELYNIEVDNGILEDGDGRGNNERVSLPQKIRIQPSIRREHLHFALRKCNINLRRALKVLVCFM